MFKEEFLFRINSVGYFAWSTFSKHFMIFWHIVRGQKAFRGRISTAADSCLVLLLVALAWQLQFAGDYGVRGHWGVPTATNPPR